MLERTRGREPVSVGKGIAFGKARVLERDCGWMKFDRKFALARRGGKPRASVGKGVGREKARAQPRGAIECGGWSENKIKIRAFVVELCCVATVATQGQINFERRS